MHWLITYPSRFPGPSGLGRSKLPIGLSPILIPLQKPFYYLSALSKKHYIPKRLRARLNPPRKAIKSQSSYSKNRWFVEKTSSICPLLGPSQINRPRLTSKPTLYLQLKNIKQIFTEERLSQDSMGSPTGTVTDRFSELTLAGVKIAGRGSKFSKWLILAC